MKLNLKKLRQKQDSNSDIKKIIGNTNSDNFRQSFFSQDPKISQKSNKSSNQDNIRPFPQKAHNPINSKISQQNLIKASKNHKHEHKNLYAWVYYSYYF